jgi:hypothetical protein
VGELGKWPIGLPPTARHYSCSNFVAQETLRGKVVPVHVMQLCGGVGLWRNLFLTSALD